MAAPRSEWLVTMVPQTSGEEGVVDVLRAGCCGRDGLLQLYLDRYHDIIDIRRVLASLSGYLRSQHEIHRSFPKVHDQH